MTASFSAMEKVNQDALQARVETVRTLEDSETESYEIVKDTETGDHYLRYYYGHLNVADGTWEHYNQLMLLESDDVLGILFGEQGYRYPDHWNKRFLRNGAEGSYVWFDPGADPEHTDDEAFGRWLAERLQSFKRDGRYDPEAVKGLLDEVERKGKDE